MHLHEIWDLEELRQEINIRFPGIPGMQFPVPDNSIQNAIIFYTCLNTQINPQAAAFDLCNYYQLRILQDLVHERLQHLKILCENMYCWQHITNIYRAIDAIFFDEQLNSAEKIAATIYLAAKLFLLKLSFNLTQESIERAGPIQSLIRVIDDEWLHEPQLAALPDENDFILFAKNAIALDEFWLLARCIDLGAKLPDNNAWVKELIALYTQSGREHNARVLQNLITMPEPSIQMRFTSLKKKYTRTKNKARFLEHVLNQDLSYYKHICCNMDLLAIALRTGNDALITSIRDMNRAIYIDLIAHFEADSDEGLIREPILSFVDNEGEGALHYWAKYRANDLKLLKLLLAGKTGATTNLKFVTHESTGNTFLHVLFLHNEEALVLAALHEIFSDPDDILLPMTTILQNNDRLSIYALAEQNLWFDVLRKLIMPTVNAFSAIEDGKMQFSREFYAKYKFFDGNLGEFTLPEISRLFMQRRLLRERIRSRLSKQPKFITDEAFNKIFGEHDWSSIVFKAIESNDLTSVKYIFEIAKANFTQTIVFIAIAFCKAPDLKLFTYIVDKYIIESQKPFSTLARIDVIRDHFGRDALSQAIQFGKSAEKIEYLIQVGCRLDNTYALDSNVLHLTAGVGDPELLDCVIRECIRVFGADKYTGLLKSRDSHGNTPLHIAQAVNPNLLAIFMRHAVKRQEQPATMQSSCKHGF